jgi:hypothetical protein
VQNIIKIQKLSWTKAIHFFTSKSNEVISLYHKNMCGTICPKSIL